MKLLTIDALPKGHAAVLVGDGEVLDLTARANGESAARWIPGSVREILEAGADGLEIVRRRIGEVEGATAGEKDGLREAGVLRAFADTPLMATVPDPWFILSAGRNYGRHLAEMGNNPKPAYPTAFIKLQSSLTGSGKPIVVPDRFSGHVDYEGEFTVVIGKTCHNVSEADALNYVAGYTICNDVSARDWIPEIRAAEESFDAILAWERNIMGKNLPTFTPCGPVMVTADEIADPHNLQLTTTLNGEVMQSTKTDDLIYNVPQIVSYFSQWYRFQPGDLITTGSPSGVGVGRDPQVFMKPGDRVEVEIEGIGTLSNPLVAE